MELNGENIKIEDIVRVSRGGENVTLSKNSRNLMLKSRKYIEQRIKSGEVIYGVNTGFGALSSVKISEKDIEKLQVNLIRSHSAGVGEPFSIEESRAILLLRANTIARGHSGVRPEVAEKILEFLNADVIPVIPSQGSVGASGDLAPLAHVALALIGEGYVWQNGRVVVTANVLKKKKIAPLTLKAKEGLSLINGCQVMTAVGALVAARVKNLVLIADIVGAMSLEALRGSRGPFDPLIQNSRPHRGEKITAKNLLKILGKTSKIADSHFDCDRVQDAYSLRCMPAVHGAVKDALLSAINTLEIEANSSTDNPLVFEKDNKILSCGNFHGEPVAFQMDFLGIALTALGNISQCRISRLISPAFTGLPTFLAPNGGLNSGMMVVEVASAALASENKIYAHPASADTVPTSVDKEDHVSMGTIAARKLRHICDNVANILSMEILSNMQGLSLLKPLTPAAGVLAAYKLLEKDVPLAKEDRVFAEDIKNIREYIDSGAIVTSVEAKIGELDF